MARRRAAANAALSRRDTFHICHGSTEVDAPRAEPMHAVVRAQTIALDSPDPVDLIVQRRSLFGPPAKLYRVVRPKDEDAVLTYTIARED